MERLRTPFQGIYNIIRFNWHFYALSLALLGILLMSGSFLGSGFLSLSVLASVLILLPLLSSLIISYYIYDHSGLYALNWLSPIRLAPDARMINIHAGFDETSGLLQQRFPKAALSVLDFYDPLKHTEASIRRARKAYPPFPGTQVITTSQLPFADNSADVIFLIFAAHEIRNEQERLVFFNELRRILKSDGKIVITEHLRDFPNFMAYTIGFFHFQPRAAWQRAFKGSGLHIESTFRLTPFIHTFILQKHGTSS